MNYPRLFSAAVAALIVFFAWGFLTEGWLMREDFAASAALYQTSHQHLRLRFLLQIRTQPTVLPRRIRLAIWTPKQLASER